MPEEVILPVSLLYRSFATSDVKPKKRKDSWEIGQCSVCLRTVETLTAGALLGSTFGSWGELTKANNVSRLCKECAWAFKTPELLRFPYKIDQTKAYQLSWKQLGDDLLDKVDPQTAYIAPWGGRKIVAPYASFGHISGDAGVFAWSPEYRKALLVCRQLNKVGIRGTLLLSDQLPQKQLAEIPYDKHTSVYEMWYYLKFIREDKNMVGFFAKLSMNMGAK